MSYYIQAYLTDAAKVEKVFGCKNKLLFEKLLVKLRYDLDDIDSEYEEKINFEKNAKTVLLDMINGKVSFKDVPYLYVLVYEKIVATFGEQIYAPSDEFDEEYFKALELDTYTFFDIPTCDKAPFVHSIPKEHIGEALEVFCTMPSIKGYNIGKLQEALADFKYAFEKAKKEGKDLVFVMS